MDPCIVHQNSHKCLSAYKCSVCTLTSGCCWSEESSVTPFADAAVVQNVRFLFRLQSVCSVCSTGRTSLVSEVNLTERAIRIICIYKQIYNDMACWQYSFADLDMLLHCKIFTVSHDMGFWCHKSRYIMVGFSTANLHIILISCTTTWVATVQMFSVMTQVVHMHIRAQWYTHTRLEIMHYKIFYFSYFKYY